MKMPGKVIGILGGMGPAATVDLFQRIVQLTPARSDEDHLHILVDCNPQIPSRQKAVQGAGPDPTPELLATARNLERAGADFLVVPCNSAHIFLPRVRAHLGIPILDMIAETVRVVEERVPPGRAVGLLATIAVLETGLYERPLRERGRKVVLPDKEDRQELMAVVYAVKGGDTGEAVRGRLLRVAQRLMEQGAQALITACTELPLLLRDGDLPVPVIDPTQVLAEAAVRYALEG